MAQIKNDNTLSRKGPHRAVLFCLCALLSAPIVAAAESGDAVKLAYLFNFTRFIQWPASPEPLDVCVESSAGFAHLLDGIEPKVVQGRKVMFQLFSGQIPENCEMAYLVDVADDTSISQHPNILTVGEGQAFTREHGIIGFVVDRNRLRYVVNNTRAREHAIVISARLLEVALDVY